MFFCPHEDEEDEMLTETITPENTIFIIISFEGPDSYSRAGGLGVRTSMLSDSLARLGFSTHHIFVGDPRLDGHELRCNGYLHLYRWCQWISAFHPYGVYDGEEGKLHDFIASAPEYVVERIAQPAIESGKLVAVLAEEWHTAEPVCRISELLIARGLRNLAVIFWNANNTFSFERINWPKLKANTTITTVSRYMRHEMRGLGLLPIVIPNGIPESSTQPAQLDKVREFRQELDMHKDVLLFKMARWDRAKGWLEAISAASAYKAKGRRVFFPVRGGIEPHGHEVLQLARALGLRVQDINLSGAGIDDFLAALLAAARNFDVLNIGSRIDPDLARVLYSASDGVLANSSHEPFGLVGLEAMAAGGLSFVGETGEDYAQHLVNSVVLESPHPEELLSNMVYLENRPGLAGSIREQAKMTARQYTWENVINQQLLPKLERHIYLH
jgi:glycosyltransferase involved in cell wall biosynthesis